MCSLGQSGVLEAVNDHFLAFFVHIHCHVREVHGGKTDIEKQAIDPRSGPRCGGCSGSHMTHKYQVRSVPPDATLIFHDASLEMSRSLGGLGFYSASRTRAQLQNTPVCRGNVAQMVVITGQGRLCSRRLLGVEQTLG